ncbi:sugar phosphate isomerase/epimerase [Planctomycetaceae bacterium]|jgi:sugar phosphate isomerase/epimerase|nr:sugar phosphate isomerase/epimerase [Planctomycetaceae bacterium]MDC0307886.1 sugar phosphate isomerase/epimerase [Planctomycetaceae bacterium]
MNDLPRLSISQVTTFHWSLPDLIAHCKDFGYEAVSLWMPRLIEFGEERAIDLIHESGLVVSSIGPSGGFTGANGHSLRDSVLDTADALELAGRVGANSLTVYTGPRAGHTKNHSRRLVKSALLRLADTAAEMRVQLALKPMHSVYGRNWSFLHSLKETFDLIEECDHPWLKLAFGTFQVGDQYDTLVNDPALVSRIASVQVSDRRDDPQNEWDQHLPGEGDLPLARIMQTLLDAEYDGFFEVDVWSRDVWNRDYADMLQTCREEFVRTVAIRR